MRRQRSGCRGDRWKVKRRSMPFHDYKTSREDLKWKSIERNQSGTSAGAWGHETTRGRPIGLDTFSIFCHVIGRGGGETQGVRWAEHRLKIGGNHL